jgi:hypothetical protein
MPCAAALAALSLAPSALAAPAPVCKLVTDPAGDDKASSDSTSTPYTDDVYDSSDLDILSADVATDAKNITAVIRTRTLHADDPDSPTGRMWQFFFVVGEQRYVLSGAKTFDGSHAMVYRETADYEEGGNGATMGEGIGRAKVAFDYRRAEVRITAPLSYFKPYTAIDKGRLLRDLMVWSFHDYGTSGTRQNVTDDYVVDIGGGGAASSIDGARSTKTYAAGARSCVVVGR